MNGDRRATTASAVSLSPPQLRVARFADYPEIYRLESTFFDDSLPPADRRSLFVDNPLWPRVSDTWPIGWVLEDADGRIVGSVNNIPSQYRFGETELICGMNRSFVQGMLDGAGESGLDAELDAAAGRCCVTIRLG